MVVLPELSSIDYSNESFDQLELLVEDLEGKSLIVWREIAIKFKCNVLYGFARRYNNSKYISTALVDPNGKLQGYYDKIHLCQYGASTEKNYFTNGKHIFTFSVKDVKCAPIICYNIRMPELMRDLALQHDVQLILHCGAYFRDESFATWHQCAVTRALEKFLCSA